MTHGTVTARHGTAQHAPRGLVNAASSAVSSLRSRAALAFDLPPPPPPPPPLSRGLARGLLPCSFTFCCCFISCFISCFRLRDDDGREPELPECLNDGASGFEYSSRSRAAAS
jgi:hypothetical protein